MKQVDAMLVETLKGLGHYYAAGAVAASIGAGKYFGCHFGMKSDRERAMAEFFAGYDAANSTKGN